MEACVCGFSPDGLDTPAVVTRVTAAAGAIAEAILSAPTACSARPTPDRWSALEYASHSRDVLLVIRDRLVLGLVADQPHCTPLFREERIALGLYAADTVDDIAGELGAAAAMFGRLYRRIPADALDREVWYGFPDPELVTLSWMGAQAVHESEHHLADIRANLSGAVGS